MGLPAPVAAARAGTRASDCAGWYRAGGSCAVSSSPSAAASPPPPPSNKESPIEVDMS